MYFCVFLLFFSLKPLWADEEAPVTQAAPAASAEQPKPKTIEDQRLDTLRFGTETEIANLIQALKNEKSTYFDKELIEIARNTRNRNIMAGIFTFFGETEKTGLEDRAIKAIQERDDEANETVFAAVDYLGKVKASQAVDCLEELINAGENRFLNSAFRALGRAVRGGQEDSDSERADNTAFFLLDYYNNRNPGDENRREIIVALGETGSKAGVSFLADLIKNQDERAVLRMAALEAVSKIGDSQALDAVI